MTKFTEVLTKILKEAEVQNTINIFFRSCWHTKRSAWNKTQILTSLNSNDIKVKFVEKFGGEEDGSDYWSIYAFTQSKEVAYIEFQGSYDSYNGPKYSSFYFVEPKETTIIVFKPTEPKVKE